MFGQPGGNQEKQDDPYAAARREMIEWQLRRRGVVRHGVLEAMEAVPRHLFVAHAFSARAYADEALPSQEGQTISQPYMVGIMTQELAVEAGQRVLEVGTGTGYQTAILAHLAGPNGAVLSIENVAVLAEAARRRLEAMQIGNVRIVVGDGSMGWPEAEVVGKGFERILLTAGAPAVPGPVLGQLAEGGILVAPVGPAASQTLIRVERRGAAFHSTELLACKFVPLVGAHGWKNGER